MKPPKVKPKGPAIALRNLLRQSPKPLVSEGQRIYAIGDIHGRSDLFDALVEQIREDSAQRGETEVEIILLGDLVDRGPDSAGMVERAAHWNADWARLECLLGNHEASMLAVLDDRLRWLDSWLTYGGVETLLSYGVDRETIASGSGEDIARAARAAVPQAHRDWLSDRPLHLARRGYLFVHAGIRPGLPLEQQEAEDLLWIRGDFLDSRADHGAMVVHGHSIREEIDERPNRIGIDTGAYATGRLTAIGLEGTDRWFLQS